MDLLDPVDAMEKLDQLDLLDLPDPLELLDPLVVDLISASLPSHKRRPLIPSAHTVQTMPM